MRVLWAIGAVLMMSGGMWLAALIWRTGDMPGRSFGPDVVGAFLAGLALARAFDRRPLVLAGGAALAWVALQAILYVARGSLPPWTAYFDGSAASHFALVGALSTAAAVAGAFMPLRGRHDHWLLWMSISALLTLGTIIAVLLLLWTEDLTAAAIILMILSPLFAGGITQVLAPKRMIWTCGGGALVFMLIIIDTSVREHETELIGPAFGTLIFVVLGALGARIAWRMFRNDLETPHVELPTATARQGDV